MKIKRLESIRTLVPAKLWCFRNFADYFYREHLQIVQKCIETKQRQVLLYPLMLKPDVICCAIADYDEYDDTIVYQEFRYCEWYEDNEKFFDEIDNNSVPDVCIRIYGYNVKL